MHIFNDLAWSKVILVEGVSGIGKSTLIDTLLQTYIQEHRSIRTLLHLTQAHTYGPLAPYEDLETLTVDKNLSHLRSITSFLSWYMRSLLCETTPKFYGLIDTLHITHCFRPGIVTWEDVKEIDQQLADLQVKLLFLKAHDETIWTRGIWRRREVEFITGYGQKFGTSLKAIHHYFIQEQADMEKMLQQSSMDKLILTIDQPLETYFRQAYDFWMS